MGLDGDSKTAAADGDGPGEVTEEQLESFMKEDNELKAQSNWYRGSRKKQEDFQAVKARPVKLDCVGQPVRKRARVWKPGQSRKAISMQGVDPLNPSRMRARRQHLLFNKKNFNVTLPYKEKLIGDTEREQELIEKYGEEMERRKHDPLLMEDKVRKFVTVFYALSRNPATPKRAKKQIETLAKIFKFRSQNEFGYAREAVRHAVNSTENVEAVIINRVKKRVANAKNRTRVQKKNRMAKMKRMGLVPDNQQFNSKMAKRVSKFVGGNAQKVW